MTWNLAGALRLVAVVLFVVAAFVAGGVFDSNFEVWGFAGLACFAGSFLP